MFSRSEVSLIQWPNEILNRQLAIGNRKCLYRRYSLSKLRVMEMADRDSQRVRGIVRRRHALKPEQQPDHLLYLVLLRVAVTDNRLLDQSR